MDNIILEKKIDSILRCIARIEERLPENEENFLKDYDAQDVIVLNRTRVVQLSVDIAVHILSKENQALPATMSEAFMKLQQAGLLSSQTAEKMKKSVGFRNVAIHSYDDLDLGITHNIAKDHLQDFKDFITEILQRK